MDGDALFGKGGILRNVKLTVLERAEKQNDWHIGYLDERPAIGNQRGEWFLLHEDAMIHNPGQRLIWLVKLEDGVWSCIHEMHWRLEPIPPPDVAHHKPDYVEGNDPR